MRAYPVLILLVIVFFGSVVLTVIGVLSEVSREDDAAIAQIGLARGHIAGLFFTGLVWSKYPMLPHPSILIDAKSILLTVPLLLGAVFITQAGKFHVLPLRIVVVLAVALLPCAAGAIALHGNDHPETAGPWLKVMLLGPLYTLAACSLLCVAEEVHQRLRCRAAGRPDICA